MANKKDKIDWNGVLSLCIELDNISTMMTAHSTKFKTASEDETLLEKDRDTLCKLSAQFSEIVDTNNKLNTEIRTDLDSKKAGKLLLKDAGSYLEYIEKLDMRMKVSGAMLEAVMQRMDKAINKDKGEVNE